MRAPLFELQGHRITAKISFRLTFFIDLPSSGDLFLWAKDLFSSTLRLCSQTRVPSAADPNAAGAIIDRWLLMPDLLRRLTGGQDGLRCLDDRVHWRIAC